MNRRKGLPVHSEDPPGIRPREPKKQGSHVEAFSSITGESRGWKEMGLEGRLKDRGLRGHRVPIATSHRAQRVGRISEATTGVRRDWENAEAQGLAPLKT